jgi:uncharacterized protein (TIGR00730 family)
VCEPDRPNVITSRAASQGLPDLLELTNHGMKSICVFCGANTGAHRRYADAARTLGAAVARRKLRLVFGGGGIGLMGVLADAALASGGEVVGVIPQALVAKELAHKGKVDLRVVNSMHERKALMADLADGFIALPGGYGTLDEFCEMLTWAQLGIHAKPCGVFNVAGYFDGFLAFLDHAAAEAFIRPEHRAMLVVDSDPEALLNRLATHPTPRFPNGSI